MDSFRKTVHPLLKLAAFHGVEMFEHRVPLLNYVQFITMWTLYIFVFVQLLHYPDIRNIFASHVYRFVILSNFLTSFIGTSLTLLHQKKFQRCLEGVSGINRTLEYLDLPNDYDKLNKLVWKVIGAAGCLAIYLLVLGASWTIILFGKVLGIIIVLIIDYPCFINIFTYLIFCVILGYIGSRFDLINKQIETFVKSNTNKTSWTSEFYYYGVGQPNLVVTKKQEVQIWIFMHIHSELCKISRKLNEIFSLQVTFEMSTYFVYISGIVVYTYELYDYTKNHRAEHSRSYPFNVLMRLIMTYSWGGLYVIRLIYFNYICETVCCKATKTRYLMHCFFNSASNSEIYEQVWHFSLSVLNKPLKLDGSGMFYFGYNFIYVFFSAVSTVAVIILQTMTGHGSLH